MSQKRDRALAQLMERVGKEMLTRIQRRTPVRTGRAQAGWALNNVTKDGFEITNDVEYVPFLEEGTSKMKPYHMVRTTLAESQQIVNDCIKRG